MEWENIFANTSDKGLISKIYLKTHKTQQQKNKQPDLKMGKGPEQTLLLRENTDGQQEDVQCH